MEALLLLADGRFPGGAYAHSGGLEPAVVDGSVDDLASLERFVTGRLTTTGVTEAWLAASACGAAGDAAALAQLDARCRCAAAGLDGVGGARLALRHALMQPWNAAPKLLAVDMADVISVAARLTPVVGARHRSRRSRAVPTPAAEGHARGCDALRPLGARRAVARGHGRRRGGPRHDRCSRGLRPAGTVRAWLGDDSRTRWSP